MVSQKEFFNVRLPLIAAFMGYNNFKKVQNIHTDITLYELYQENGNDLDKTITALKKAIRGGGKEEISARKKSARKKSARNAKKNSTEEEWEDLRQEITGGNMKQWDESIDIYPAEEDTDKTWYLRRGTSWTIDVRGNVVVVLWGKLSVTNQKNHTFQTPLEARKTAERWVQIMKQAGYKAW